eukprot:scaffold79986_cov20-Tisochrysis_lutea.AAC.2
MGWLWRCSPVLDQQPNTRAISATPTSLHRAAPSWPWVSILGKRLLKVEEARLRNANCPFSPVPGEVEHT